MGLPSPGKTGAGNRSSFGAGADEAADVAITTMCNRLEKHPRLPGQASLEP